MSFALSKEDTDSRVSNFKPQVDNSHLEGKAINSKQISSTTSKKLKQLFSSFGE